MFEQAWLDRYPTPQELEDQQVDLSVRTAAFAVASVNVGATGTITVSADTGEAVLPLALSLCQTNPANGSCLAPPAKSVTLNMTGSATPTFSVFLSVSGEIPLDPAVNRIFVYFGDGSGNTRGLTSVAVRVADLLVGCIN